MKWVVATMNVSTVTRMLRAVRSMSRVFATLAGAVLLFLFVTGLMGLANWSVTSSSTMKGAAASLSASFFMDMLAMEMPQLEGNMKPATFSPKNTATFLVRYLIGIHPADPASLLASELPGMRGEASALLYSGQATKDTDGPADFTPPPDAFRAGQGLADAPVAPPAEQSPAQPQAGTAQPPAQPLRDVAAMEPQIFIYHSHNRESFLPELKAKGITKPDLAYDEDVNVTLVGKRLKEKVEALGIPAMQSTADYPTSVKDFNYAKSYAYSAVTVKEAMAQHSKLGMIFDIHRDSLARDKTTVRIGNQDYAQVYFVVGKKNPGWERNSEFASSIHNALETKMPGISRGVYGKASNGNGEYNQSLSPNSILMEIGGPYNTLQEMYRTADLLADIIVELQRNAVKANAPAGAASTGR
ncbi:stage II sporulation protein P [Paenibacillus hodogayensis]|uniref:Stage II sporulation protein P n=1 Tax=Paenibacillus hodogayensis TaxID=279208 RepID=A0ABV5VSP8_9BACL